MIGIDTTFLVHLELLEMPHHEHSRELLERHALTPGVPVALVPQVLAEFIHVVTDSRRFQHPLAMPRALARAEFWWTATEVRHVYPTAESINLFIQWMANQGLGRKRILDTQLAATLWSAGVDRLFTWNARDFLVFGGFELIGG